MYAKVSRVTTMRRQFEADQAGHHQRAGHQGGRGQHDGGQIQIAGPGHGQKAAGQQTQQRELEEPVHLVGAVCDTAGDAVADVPEDTAPADP